MVARWSSAGVLCLAVVGFGAVCVHLDLPPPIVLPPPSARPPGQLPAEAARMKTPPWARLEQVWGATNNLHHRGAASSAFAPDGRTLVTLGQDGRLRVWDLPSRTLRAQLDVCVEKLSLDGYPYDHRGKTVAVSADGLVAAGFGGGRICVVDLGTGGLVRNIDAHRANVAEVAFAGGRLVSYGYQERVVDETSIGPLVVQHEAGGEARWWDPRTGRKMAELVVGPREALGVIPDGDRLAGAGDDVGVWHRDGRALWRHPLRARAVAVIAGGTLLAARHEGGLLALSAETGRTAGTLEAAHGRPEAYEAVAATADGRFAASITDTNAALVLWDVRARREIGRSVANARSVAFSPDGSMLVTSSGDGVVVWSTRALAPFWFPVPAPYSGETILPDGRRVLTCTGSVARLWELATGQTIRRWSIREGADAVLMPGGARALESYYDESWMRDLRTGAVIWSIHRTYTHGTVLVSPDGSRVTSVGRGFEGTQLHDTANGKIVWQHPSAEPLAFSADGRRLYVRTYDWHILGLDTADGSVRLQIDRERTDTRAFYVSPNGKFALAVSWKDLTGYDLATGKRLWRIQDTGYLHVVLPDGSAFVSDDYSSVRLRSTATGLDLAPPLPLEAPPDSMIGFMVTADGKSMFLTSFEGLTFRFALDPAAR